MSDDSRDHMYEDNDSFDLDAFFENFDFAAAQQRIDEQKVKELNVDSMTDAKTKVDLGTTMTYAAAGEQKPELPFAADNDMFEPKPQESWTQESSHVGRNDKSPPEEHNQKSTLRETPAKQDQRISSRSSEQDRELSSKPQYTVGRLKAHPSNSSPKTRKTPADKDILATAKTARGSFYNRISAVGATSSSHREINPQEAQKSDGAFRPLTSENNSYTIRGGGIKQQRNHVFTAIYAVVIIAAFVFAIFVVQNTISSLLSSGSNPFTLTEAEARSAIDTSMPALTNIVSSDFDTVTQAFINNGHTIFQDDRYTPESIDPTANRHGILRMPQEVSAEFISDFYQGSYNAYTTKTLQESFNGSWVLDMTRGNLGSLFKVKYANFAAKDIETEMNRLTELQGLTGENVSVAARGKDPRGNTVIQGTKTVDDVVYYWKIAACPFSEVYTTEYVPTNSVYISCTVATFDFYTGGDAIT